MKLNPREKIMLIALAILIVLAGSYFLLIKPELDQIDLLKIEKDELEIKIDEINKELSMGSKIDADIMELDILVEEMTKDFYPEILKDKIIVLLDDLVNKTNIENDSVVFSKIMIQAIKLNSITDGSSISYPLNDLANEYLAMHPLEEVEEVVTEESIGPVIDTSGISIDEKKIKSMSIKFQLNGTYEQLTSFIKEIEALERSVVITDLVVVKGEEEQLLSNMDVIFYAIPKMYEQDEEYYEWEYENEYGKVDPF